MRRFSPHLSRRAEPSNPCYAPHTNMVNQRNAGAPLPRTVTLARVWLLVLGCAWFLAGFLVGTTGRSRWLAIGLVAVGILHFAVARYAGTRRAVFFSSSGRNQ